MKKHFFFSVFLIILFVVEIYPQKTGLPVSRVALRSGIPLSAAMKVAVTCLREAAGFKTISDERRVKLYRHEDKLVDLGISTPDRLNALRRYIVRNEEIGVQSVYDLDTPAGAAYIARRFIIPLDGLKELSTSWTLLKLAQTIQESAGLPRMPISTAAAIVSDCRKYPDDRNPEPKPAATATPVPTPTPSPAPTPIFVKYDLRDRTNLEKVINCIVTSEKYGVPSVKTYTPDDEEVSYFLNVKGDTADKITQVEIDETVALMKFAIENDNWNYQCLISYIAQNAQVRMPLEQVAAGIVISNILKQLRDAGAVKEPIFNDKTTLGQIQSGDAIPVRLNLAALKTKIEEDIEPASPIPPCSSAELRNKADVDKKPALSKGFSVRRLKTLPSSVPNDPDTRVKDLIGAVEGLINQ